MACAAASIPGLIEPLDGELRFTSAITDTVSRLSASRKLFLRDVPLCVDDARLTSWSFSDLRRARRTSSPRVPTGGVHCEFACVSGVVRLIFEFGKCSGTHAARFRKPQH